MPTDERARLVKDAAETLGLGDLLDRKPAQLSGGQRQRVALARAIVRRPQAFLMDEPLSNLDAKLRVQTRADLIELQARLEATVVYVTHDQVEAMTMGHRIAIMADGELQQVGPPQDVYERPANLFVAGFIGTPPMNIIPAAGRAATARHSRVEPPRRARCRSRHRSRTRSRAQDLDELVDRRAARASRCSPTTASCPRRSPSSSRSGTSATSRAASTTARS